MSERPTRFCLVTTFYPPHNLGGDGIAVRRLAVALAERGHHVEVVHCTDAFDAVRTSDVPVADTYDDHPAVVHHGLRSGVGALSPLLTQQTGRPVLKRRALQRILGGSAFDVVHFHNTSLIGLTALSYSAAKILYTMHDHSLVCPMHVLWRNNREPCATRTCTRCQLHGRRPPQLWRHSALRDRAVRHVNAFIAPSEFTRAKHRELGFEPDAPIEHIPNFLPDAPAPTVTTPRQHPRPYYLYVGRLERIKGPHVAVRAFQRFKDADLLIAGAGNETATLRESADGYPHIHFLGQLPSTQLESLMREAIAVIVPSVGYEVFPTTVLEANAQGTPVIGHRLGPLPEMLDGRGGSTYETDDELIAALVRLQSDPEYRAMLGARGRSEYLGKWTPERHLERYFALIHSLQPESRSFA